MQHEDVISALHSCRNCAPAINQSTDQLTTARGLVDRLVDRGKPFWHQTAPGALPFARQPCHVQLHGSREQRTEGGRGGGGGEGKDYCAIHAQPDCFICADCECEKRLGWVNKM